MYLIEPSFHSRTPNNSTFMKNISWCPCLKVRVNFYPRRNYAAHFTVGHYSKQRIIWPRQQGAGQLRCDGPGLYAACCYIRRLMTHVISPASAPAQPPTSQRSGFPNNSFRRAATMFISLCGATHGWRWCVGESYQPKYYLIMVVSRCWAGKGLGWWLYHD